MFGGLEGIPHERRRPIGCCLSWAGDSDPESALLQRKRPGYTRGSWMVIQRGRLPVHTWQQLLSASDRAEPCDLDAPLGSDYVMMDHCDIRQNEL